MTTTLEAHVETGFDKFWQEYSLNYDVADYHKIKRAFELGAACGAEFTCEKLEAVA